MNRNKKLYLISNDSEAAGNEKAKECFLDVKFNWSKARVKKG